MEWSFNVYIVGFMSRPHRSANIGISELLFPVLKEISKEFWETLVSKTRDIRMPLVPCSE